MKLLLWRRNISVISECYIQRKVDTDDADHKFNNIWKANKKFAYKATYITAYVLCSVSLLTMAAISVYAYRKAVYGALWVQLALVGCYLPIGISGIVIASSNTYSSHLIVTWGVALVLVYFNSALNPVLYCWRISEMRQAVKQTISQALCCPLN